MPLADDEHVMHFITMGCGGARGWHVGCPKPVAGPPRTVWTEEPERTRDGERELKLLGEARREASEKRPRPPEDGSPEPADPGARDAGDGGAPPASGDRGDGGPGGPGEGPRHRMDIPREQKGDRKKYIWVGAAAVAVVAITVALARLEPAAPSVDRDILLFGTVERGTFVREVRGPGTLVPEQMVFVSAVAGGRVEEVFVDPGETVEAGTVLLTMSNPDVELQSLQAQQQLTSARAGVVELRRSLGSQVLAQEAAVASTRAEYQEARRQAESDSALVERQLISRNEASRSRERAQALAIQLENEEGQLELLRQTMEEQLAVQREQVQRLESILAYQERRVESLRVSAGAGGVLQDLSLEVGQWVQPGTTLARVAKPDRLKAELRIPETQARDVQVGQRALIDTRNDTIQGSVRRVDPNVQNASVLVEVNLEEELPPGARPDLSVDGTIEIERLEDVLYVDRPVYGQSHSTVSLFKVTPGESEAVRVTVRLGRSSVNQIEVLDGLEEGDTIILSDMSQWDDADRVRID